MIQRWKIGFLKASLRKQKGGEMEDRERIMAH
jgi:hypothetical protein